MAKTRVEPAVCFGSSQRSWVTDVINYVSDHGGMRVVGTVLTQDDAVGLEFDVLVIDDVSSVLSPRLIDRLQALGRLVIGVFDSDRGPASRDRLLTANVDAVVASDAAASEFVRVVADAVRQRSIDDEFADLMDDIDGQPAARDADPVVTGHGVAAGMGQIVTVVGTDGVTEVVVGLALSLARAGERVVLVDMDTLEPSLAQRLGMALTPNIFTATEHLRLRSSINDAFASHPEGFAVIAGIPNPREWENLSETEAADLVGELATGFDVVVVKINRHLEDLSSFAGASGRFDVGRRMAGIAHTIVAVTSASPLGSTRLLALAGDLRHLTSAPTHVVVNQSPSSSFVQGEIGEELFRTMAPASLTFLTLDGKVRKASWQGEVVRSGAFMRRIGRLAEQLTPHPAEQSAPAPSRPDGSTPQPAAERGTP